MQDTNANATFENTPGIQEKKERKIGWYEPTSSLFLVLFSFEAMA